MWSPPRRPWVCLTVNSNTIRQRGRRVSQSQAISIYGIAKVGGETGKYESSSSAFAFAIHFLESLHFTWITLVSCQKCASNVPIGFNFLWGGGRMGGRVERMVVPGTMGEIISGCRVASPSIAQCYISLLSGMWNTANFFFAASWYI